MRSRQLRIIIGFWASSFSLPTRGVVLWSQSGGEVAGTQARQMRRRCRGIPSRQQISQCRLGKVLVISNERRGKFKFVNRAVQMLRRRQQIFVVRGCECWRSNSNFVEASALLRWKRHARLPQVTWPTTASCWTRILVQHPSRLFFCPTRVPSLADQPILRRRDRRLPPPPI
jgi:hypothetical protein